MIKIRRQAPAVAMTIEPIIPPNLIPSRPAPYPPITEPITPKIISVIRLEFLFFISRLAKKPAARPMANHMIIFVN